MESARRGFTLREPVGVVVGKGLIEQPGTDKVSFTGSVPTGIAVGQTAMGAGLTRATLELGGKNSAGFLLDVDLDKAVNGVIEAGFLHSGQISPPPNVSSPIARRSSRSWTNSPSA